MKTLFSVAGVLVGLWALVVLAAYLLQDRMLFFPQPVASSARDQLEEFQTQFTRDGVTLRGWLFLREDSDDRPFLVYYGGNGEEVSWNFARFVELPIRGFLLMNYRGYGDSDGSPSAGALRSDATFVLDELLTQKQELHGSQIVLMGRSLGSGVAVHVASERQLGGLVLVTPFDRLSSLASHHYPYLPVRTLLRHEMDSLALAPDLSTPSLVVVAEHDEVVPPRYAHRLHEALGGPKQLVTIAGGGHNDLDRAPEYWRAIEGFLQSR